jgi:hypothetical protein
MRSSPPRVRSLLVSSLVALAAAPSRAQSPVSGDIPSEPPPAPASAAETPVPENSSTAPVATPGPVAAPAPVPAASPAPAAAPATGDGVFVRRRVPRTIGLWLGWGWNPVNHLPLREDGAKVMPHGASLVFDYGWQVGGLRPGGWPTYVGFLAGATYYPGASDRRHALTLEYGILVRHHLATHWKVHPFLGYGLGAIQAFVFGLEGRGIGHLTRLSVGIEGNVSPRTRLAFEVIYKIDPIRSFKIDPAMDKPRFDIHTLSAMFGVNFTL